MNERVSIPVENVDSANPLGREYATQQAAFDRQPASVQRFLESQARILADALMQHPSQVRFNLPDRVVLDVSGLITPIPQPQHEQIAGGFLGGLTRSDSRTAIRQLLSNLEGSDEAAVAAAAGLVRYATVTYMVHSMLPAGRSVIYQTAEGETIPSVPVIEANEAASALTAESDAIAEEADGSAQGELLVPYVPAARRFYLPQWVAFDENGQLLVKSTQQAEAYIASMQHFLSVLHAAVALAPYIVTDVEYQRKRYGMLGQLVNQGRALAIHETRKIIQTIQQRAASDDLNRGLSLRLPYFDDQLLQLKLHDFQVIPAGRIMFLAGLVVRASQQEQAKVTQDTRLSASTRTHLLYELEMLAQAFVPTKR